MQIPDEKAPEIIEVSYSKAKQLAKKPMSEKQSQNIQKLVEMNRLKWETQKKVKDEQFKKMQSEQEAKSTKVLVKPKRIYPPRLKKQQEPEYEEEEEDISDQEEESEQEVYQNKPKPKQPPKPNKPTTPAPRPDLVAMKQKLEQLETQLKPTNAYSNLAFKFWKG
jgi:hypothetical protein